MGITADTVFSLGFFILQMATVYKRLSYYQQRGGTAEFSKKKYKKLCQCIANLYDKKPFNPAVGYVESIENGVSFQVRDYPDGFTRIIDAIIFKFSSAILNPPPPTPPQKKERKRIPTKAKPVFSTRKIA